jgi:lactate dehydrogenase-like 2-hydroxyacid dehydrogenase
LTKLLITRRLPEANLETAQAEFDVTLRYAEAPLTPEEARAALAEYDAILPTLGDAFTAAAFADPDPRCRIVANFGVGYNHIDVAAAKARGITVTNTPGAVTDATADIALTLILMTARRAGEGERLVRAGGWRGWQPTQMLGMHVTGKTLGVIGMGRIGQAIARRCHAGFGMDVVFHNRSTLPELSVAARQLDSARAVAAAADILVVAVPGGAETHHLVGQEVFEAMPPHAIFVNIARGDVVDEAALIAALAAGRIAGAGLDVYEFEPKVPRALTEMENVTLLPHLGTAALEVREAMGQLASG